MTDAELIALAERYFAALDARDTGALAATLAPGCILSIETHGIVHDGRAAIVALFADRWTGDTAVRHHDFTHTPSAATGRIASQFTVTYSHPGGTTEQKSNANVFTAARGALTRIAVYMAGANAIRAGS